MPSTADLAVRRTTVKNNFRTEQSGWYPSQNWDVPGSRCLWKLTLLDILMLMFSDPTIKATDLAQAWTDTAADPDEIKLEIDSHAAGSLQRMLIRVVRPPT
jgi:hypothetical protein